MMAGAFRFISKRLFTKYNIHKSCTRIHSRTLLSDAYYCRDAWANRLQSSLLQKVNVEEYAVKLQDLLDREGSVNAVDIDILMTKLSQFPERQLDFAQALLYRYRHTNECVNTAPSTHYSIVRELLDIGQYDRLWEILQDKINYGVFLDNHAANILMDHFIKKKLFKEAANVAYDQMLQEDFSHPMVHALAWYASHLRWGSLDSAPSAPAQEEAAQEQEEEDEDEEKEPHIIKVRYIQNPWYDDHFDIPKESWLLGKTLTMLTRGDNSIMGNSYRLIGFGLYEKYNEGIAEMSSWLESSDTHTVCQQAISDFETRLENLATEELRETKEPGVLALEHLYPYVTSEQKEDYIQKFQEVKEKLQTANKITDDFDIHGELLKFVQSAVSQHEEIGISEQLEQFKVWDSEREKRVETQIEELKKSQREKALMKQLEELRNKELKLTYFDNLRRIKIMKKRGEKLEELEKLFQTEEFVHWSHRW